MSNGSTNIFQVIFRNIFGTGKSSALTSKNNEVILKLVKMHILEMEDVLFHLNSAVMMPENPQGESSNQGGGAGEEQLTVTGLKALALVYKQFEFDPENKIVISGHTDTSGTFDFNFKLSDERAKNILYLLIGTKEEWAKICYGRHKIEDYQQIMKHFEKKLACDCDPEKVDDTWGDKTKKATLNFFKKTAPDKAISLYTQVENDSKKRWPEEAWFPVYDLYSQEIAEVLEISLAGLESRRKSSVKFIDDKKTFVGCGESFPIDSKEKDNYKSQKNRRVEILFFDKDEIPELNCPAVIDRAHKEDECPLWRKFYFIPLYIDPADLKAVVFHLQFVYYDRVKQKQLPVPDGLKINAFETGHKKIPTESIYKKGVYFVKVKFNKKIKDPARTEFYFEFDAEDKWVFTKDDKTDPVVIIKKKADFDSLTFIEKQKYYDLPKFWSSRNYWTRYDGDVKKGDRFEKVFKDIQKLKPLGDKITKPDKPLVFSLDDIVLVDTAKSQVLSDKNPAGNSIPLDDNSRYTIFHIDYDTKENVGGTQKNLSRIKIYNPEEEQPVFSNFKFKKNLITDVPIFTRVVYFCNDFYDVEYKRSLQTDTSFDYTKGHVAGARLAIKNDNTLHHFQDFQESNASDKTNGYGYNATFHFELHYFHNCAVLDNKMLSYLFIYWSCRLDKDTAKGGTDNDVKNHRKEGMKNAMDRLNKDYLAEKSSGSEDIFIRPFHFMEAKNKTNGGSQKHSVKITDNSTGSWNRPTNSSFRAACYQPEPGGWGGGDAAGDIIVDTDGKTYIPLANHHEMGHATGCFDDYLYSLEINNDAGDSQSVFIPRFSPQHIDGGPFSCDDIARMKSNRSSRLRNYWKYFVWLHDMSKTAQGANPAGPLNPLLKGTRFRIKFPGSKNGKAFNHIFELKDEHKNISKSTASDLNYELVTLAGTSQENKAKVDLLLYKLGDDQLSHFKNLGKLADGYETTQVYYGILVVKMKFAIKFTGGWDFANKRRWMQKLDEDLKTMLNAKFYLECAHNDYKKVYLFFVPHFSEYTGAVPGDSNMNVVVGWTAGTGFSHPSTKNVTLDRGTNGNEQNNQIKRLIRCSTANSHGTTNTGNPSKNDFPKIVEWIKGKLGNVNVQLKNI
jgi:outer membrane protein OmpA-like peptidoglycan-associated protein